MAIAFRGHDIIAVTNGNSATFTFLSPNSGSVPVAGDVVVIVSGAFGRAGNEGRIGNALGYTEVNDLTATTRRIRVAWKVFVAGETGPVVEGTGNNADAMAAVAIWFSGVDTTNPFSTTNTTATGNSTNPDPPAITPADNDCAIVVLAGSGIHDATPGTITNYNVLASASASDTNPNSATIAYRLLSGGSGSPENPAAFTTWAAGNWGVVTAALKPEAVNILMGQAML
jgi:hypothetical protein